VTIPVDPPSFSDDINGSQLLQWTYSLLWTFVPTLFMGLYGAVWTGMLEQLLGSLSIVDMLRVGRSMKATAPSTPRPGPTKPTSPLEGALERSTAKKTVLLDYGQYTPGLNFVVAWRNGHRLIALCMAIKILLFFATAFSSAVFTTSVVPTNITTTITSSTIFDGWLSWAEVPDLQSSFEAVSATLINRVASYPWTTSTHAFVPFDLPDALSDSNITGSTQVHWSQTSCRQIPINSRSLNLSLERGNEKIPSVTVKLDFEDRNCTISKWIIADSAWRRYVQTWSQSYCPATGKADPDDAWDEGNPWRIGIIAGDFDPTANSPTGLDNLTIISCMPSLWEAYMDTTVSLDPTSTGQVISSANSQNITRKWPLIMDSFITKLPQYKPVEPPTNEPGVLGFKFDSFARLVYKYAIAQNETTGFTSSDLGEAVPIAFNAFIAAWANQAALSRVPASAPFEGTLTVPQTRLVVTRVASFAVVGIMCAAFLVLLWVAYYSHTYRHDLLWHTEGVLGHAALAYDSEEKLKKYVEAVRKDAVLELKGFRKVGEIDLVEHASQKDDLSAWKCWAEVESLDDRDALVIHLEDPVPPETSSPAAPALGTTQRQHSLGSAVHVQAPISTTSGQTSPALPARIHQVATTLRQTTI